MRSRACAKRLELAQHWAREPFEAVGHDECSAPVARLVAQEHLEDVPELAGRALDGARTDLFEQLRKQLLARLAARLDPRNREVLELAQPLPHERCLTNAGGTAQEQRLNLLVDQLIELQQRIAHRMRSEYGSRGAGCKRVRFELVLFEEQGGRNPY